MNRSWVPGGAWAMVAGVGAVMVDHPPDPGAFPALRASLGRGAVMEAARLLGSLPLDGRGSVAILGSDGGHFALWGSSTALAGVDGHAVLVQGSGEAAWTFRTVAGADGVVLGNPRVDLSHRRPVTQGECSAASVQLGSSAVTAIDQDAGSGPATAEEVPASVFSEMWGHTISRPVEAAALRDKEAEETPAGVGTAGSRPAEQQSAQSQRLMGAPDTVPNPAVDAVAPPAAPARYLVHDGQTLPPWKSQQLRDALAQLHVVASTGERVALVDSVVVGRSPTADGLGAGVLAVSGSRGRVSRNHVRLAREGTSVVVTDLGSANGSSIIRRGRVIALVPRVATALVDEDSVELGDGVTLRIERS